MTLETGTRLGHYRIVGLLGRGGMADVYRAEDERLGREVALKAVPPEFARDPERVERFEQEVRAAARLTHTNVVTVYEFGQGAGQHFYTMALMPGGDLKVRIRAHPDGMPPEEARAVAAAMARALDYAHRQGFVHRDVKPANILFGEDGSAQLTDFGIARAMSSGTRMTGTGMSIGSPHYMSPEQARGKEVDGRSDLYSLGVVLYEMLTGRVPFDAADTLAVAYSHVNYPVPELPPSLAASQPVVDRLLAKSADPAPRAGETQVFDGMEFVWIPAGEFRMGSPGAEARDSEQPVRTVRIGEGFWLGKHEVTQAEWQRVMGSNPSMFDECGPTCPVERVRWDDAQEFIGRLNGRGGGNRYRLPTEAEWEYAARAGTTTAYWWGNEIGDNRANCAGCGSRWDNESTAPVGSFAANAWGLHDVHGNVWEWVQDCWHDSYDGAPEDESAWTVGGDCNRRVLRGGSWFSTPGVLRAAYRVRGGAGGRIVSVGGFRVARTLGAP